MVSDSNPQSSNIYIILRQEVISHGNKLITKKVPQQTEGWYVGHKQCSARAQRERTGAEKMGCGVGGHWRCQRPVSEA